MEAIEEIYQSIKKIGLAGANRHDSFEQQWIIDHLQDDQLQQKAQDLSIVALHMLSALEFDEKTGIELATQIDVTRGAITRASKKLIENNLIESWQKKENRKSIFYSLTDDGRKIAQVHDQLHDYLHQNLVEELASKYNREELGIVASFLADFLQEEQKIR